MPPLLSELKNGQQGTIESISVGSSKNCLEAMGFYPSIRIEVLASARIMRVRLPGATLALDCRMAEAVNVVLDDECKDSQN